MPVPDFVCVAGSVGVDEHNVCDHMSICSLRASSSPLGLASIGANGSQQIPDPFRRILASSKAIVGRAWADSWLSWQRSSHGWAAFGRRKSLGPNLANIGPSSVGVGRTISAEFDPSLAESGPGPVGVARLRSKFGRSRANWTTVAYSNSGGRPGHGWPTSVAKLGPSLV